ncbi:hypothetical protein CDCA_CDCA06G1942 [Cyanidium caldarium]|uniref:1-(5-phosphoribosyl)-5-[(5-phosphoribosylamino)methylideneamino]imidazole-4-carboxamideisomerase n=1 Tax=Cyanidium caldarium TaxID=2771 RepID=A0AAV9IUB9_CYACA|nr:hypothetical protein CDCA_CDCA06G1942 [Cyanidium caldarium]
MGLGKVGMEVGGREAAVPPPLFCPTTIAPGRRHRCRWRIPHTPCSARKRRLSGVLLTSRLSRANFSPAPSTRVTRFRPCIDIHDGRVKQVVGSTLTADGAAVQQTNFETDVPASYFADRYREDRLPGGHVIILGGERAASERAALEALAAFPHGLQFGGGVSADNARHYLDAGASHVIVTSYVFHHGAVDIGRLEQLRRVTGRERLVLDLSCRPHQVDDTVEYFVYTERWTRRTDVRLDATSLQRLAEYCSEFLVHAVDVEGKKCGLDETLVQRLADISPIPVTYAGGVRSVGDLEYVRQAGGGRVDVTVGSALDLFGGTLPYTEAVAWQRLVERAKESV